MLFHRRPTAIVNRLPEPSLPDDKDDEATVEEKADDTSFIPDDMAAEARERGAPAISWWLARSAGINLDTASRLAAVGEEALLASVIAVRQKLATAEEVAEASARTASFAYLLARSSQLSHSEALRVSDVQVDIRLIEAVVAKFGSQDALSALDAGIKPEDYALYRRVASHAQAMEAASLGISAHDYVLAAGAGAAHDEIVETVRSGLDLWDYARRKTLGLTVSTTPP